jgi:hypothetical protein
VHPAGCVQPAIRMSRVSTSACVWCDSGKTCDAQDLAAQLEKLSLKSEPFILQPKFWEDEGGGDVPGNCAPLLNRNNSYLATEAAANKDIIDQTAKWPALCGADKVTSLPAVQPVKGAGTTESILWRDAERTFKTEPFREQMIKVMRMCTGTCICRLSACCHQRCVLGHSVVCASTDTNYP